VIGNKIDLEARQAVSPQEGEAFASQIGFEFFETSALQSKNIEEPFNALARMYRDKFEETAARLSA
jgi:Ras-related protein Rab-21